MHESYADLIAVPAASRWDIQGWTSHAYRNWLLLHDDIERFAIVGLAMIEDAHERMWSRAESEISSGIWDVGSRYEVHVALVNSIDQSWMHLSAALKDAVSAYELYLEEAIIEILHVQGVRPLLRPQRLLPWRALRDWYRTHLDAEVGAGGVDQVREARHILTHVRGELRTEAQRKQWENRHSPELRRKIALTPESLHEMMETLAARASSVEDKVARHTGFGGSVAGTRLTDPFT